MTDNRLRGLYAITDENLLNPDCFSATVEQVLQGGARIIQYRDKSTDLNKRLRQASALRELCDSYRATLIINDDCKLARDVDADGVHLGRHDGSINQARTLLGAERLIGVSCYDRLSLALDAQQQGADYVAFGAFFRSPTKPDATPADITLLQTARQQLQIPVCAIGGITRDNAAILVQHGADMLAVISDIFADGDSRQAAQAYTDMFACSDGKAT